MKCPFFDDEGGQACIHNDKSECHGECARFYVERMNVSKFNQKRIEQWRSLTKQWHEADDHTRCPACGEQFIQCGCVRELAQDIMESLYYRKLHIPEEGMFKRLKV